MSLTDTTAMCTLAEVKDDLGLSVSTYDSALERRVLAASAMVESYCNRRFRRVVNKVEKMSGYGTTRLLPSLTPVESVTEILLESSIIDPDSYELEEDADGDGWAIYSPTGWRWTVPGVQTIASPNNPLPGQERQLYQVTYTGGWYLPNDTNQDGAELPLGLREAVIALTVHLWRQRGKDGNIMAESVGGASVQYGYLGGVDAAPASHGGIPGSIAAMLQAYRRAI